MGKNASPKDVGEDAGDNGMAAEQTITTYSREILWLGEVSPYSHPHAATH